MSYHCLAAHHSQSTSGTKFRTPSLQTFAPCFALAPLAFMFTWWVLRLYRTLYGVAQDRVLRDTVTQPGRYTGTDATGFEANKPHTW